MSMNDDRYLAHIKASSLAVFAAMERFQNGEQTGGWWNGTAFCSYPDIENEPNFIVSIWKKGDYLYQGTITPGRYAPRHRLSSDGTREVRVAGNFAWAPDYPQSDEWVTIEAYIALIEANIQQYYANA